ncbi:alanine--tRNA ligase [bacterium]|nr:alanine--tRNA ligase [candidate division CSSED10-310 bacterium]
MKSSFDIRKEFVDFFTQHGHSYIRGTPLFIPDDPTLLFTNAGMNQFKSIFLGKTLPAIPRATNYQRCMRVSGKHNDLEEVGFSPHHHTLFEMLGNWSFGDYYKKDAIQWAWTLLTEEWGLDRSRLWVTVFKDDQNEIPEDQEAGEIWRTMTTVPEDHIRFFGRKDNFWEMGDTGPCGPCTEIHMDRGPEFCDRQHIPGHRCEVNGDCRRIVEIWNLVFIQYNRLDLHTLISLPSRHVDTGMGLERVTAILQDAPSNYDTDLFKPIITAVQTLSNQSFTNRNHHIHAYRVIADHIRAASFLLTDGVLPSNEWRGYVLRRIIRRAVRFGTKIGFSSPFLHAVATTFIKEMAPVYPELEEARSHIQSVLNAEEERFFKTLDQGLPLVNDAITSIRSHGGSILPGEDAFKFYDTFGFPLDITREIAEESGLTVDEAGFQNAMNQQKTRARTAWKAGETRSSDSDVWQHVAAHVGSISFTGYATLQENSRVRAIIDTDHTVESVSETNKIIGIIIDPNPFYAESGGQIGDCGRLESPSSRLKVLDTQAPIKGLAVLHCQLIDGTLRVGDSVAAHVMTPRRQAIARNHTATHLLHRALRDVLGDHVKQSGSLVTEDRLRFDFTHHSSVSPEDLLEIERRVNHQVLQDFAVETHIMPLDDALESGVMALFGERYEDQVRVVRIDSVSAELCGGTHVSRTGQIGLLKIVSEVSVAAGVRRIEAITGLKTFERLTETEALLRKIADILKSPLDHIPDRIEKYQKQIRSLSRDVEHYQYLSARQAIDDKLKNPDFIEKIPAVIQFIPGIQQVQLRDLADQVKSKLGSGLTVLATRNDDKVFLIAAVTPDLISTIHAGKLVGQVAKLVGGGGGGRPDMAQAGGSQPERIDDALRSVPGIVACMIKEKGD